MTRNRWKNAATNCESDVDAGIDSDHYPLWIKIKIKFKKLSKREVNKKSFNYNPTEEQLINFNQAFAGNLAETASRHIGDVDKALIGAAKALEKTSNDIKKPWISETTFELIKQKHDLEQNCAEGVRKKIKEIRRSKRNDWKNYTEQIVNNDLDVRDKWLGIKYPKKQHKPSLYEFANRHGNVVNLNEKAEATADYLEQVQWKTPEPMENNDPLSYSPPCG